MLVLLLESQREFSVKFEKQSLSTRRLIDLQRLASASLNSTSVLRDNQVSNLLH